MDKLPLPDKKQLESIVKQLTNCYAELEELSEMAQDYIDCSLRYSEGQSLGEVMYAIEFAEGKLNSVLSGRSRYA